MHTLHGRYSHTFVGGLIVVAALAVSDSAEAQPISYRITCTNYGPNSNEPLGDRDGHSVQVGDATCIVQGGPMDGAVGTQQVIWEYDKGVGTLLSAHTVFRRPGAMLISVGRTGKLNLQMADGRVTGWTASGVLSYPMATGPAAVLDKKSATWTGRPTGNRTFVIEFTVE